MNINELGERLDIKKAARLIAKSDGALLGKVPLQVQP